MKLNLGSGRDIREGFTNLDRVPLPGVDVVANLENGSLPFPDDSVDEFLLSHVIEHVRNVLPMMQELYRIAKPGAKMTVRVPYGSSDDAWEDPTHVRPYFVNSWMALSAPYYWRADYLYRGDWQPKEITLQVSGNFPFVTDAKQAMECINTRRNMVSEMIAELTAVKPAREPKRELQEAPKILLKR